MPRDFFDHSVNDSEIILASWKTLEYKSAYEGLGIISAPQQYFGHEIDIEDGTPAGYHAFASMQA